MSVNRCHRFTNADVYEGIWSEWWVIGDQFTLTLERGRVTVTWNPGGGVESRYYARLDNQYLSDWPEVFSVLLKGCPHLLHTGGFGMWQEIGGRKVWCHRFQDTDKKTDNLLFVWDIRRDNSEFKKFCVVRNSDGKVGLEGTDVVVDPGAFGMYDTPPVLFDYMVFDSPASVHLEEWQ